MLTPLTTVRDDPDVVPGCWVRGGAFSRQHTPNIHKFKYIGEDPGIAKRQVVVNHRRIRVARTDQFRHFPVVDDLRMHRLWTCRRQLSYHRVPVRTGFPRQATRRFRVNREARLFRHRVGASHSDIVGQQVCDGDDVLRVALAHQDDVAPTFGERYVLNDEARLHRGEGIVSTIGSSLSHKDVLENPDKISKTVLAKGLDSGTAF